MRIGLVGRAFGVRGGISNNVVELTITGTSAIPFNMMPLMRSGNVTNGQTARGFIGCGGNLNLGDVYIKFCDPGSGGTTDEAGWKVHT